MPGTRERDQEDIRAVFAVQYNSVPRYYIPVYSGQYTG
ncbi:predicted protein [Plenodomus lingam JN3]|uniref:Predicted protein n=1 Tax=Leptosphaeria maculans (strain JN3 / isolate v23.1.3 / race Av1-4-5-6-7-8) TaxID=985895 RepID=E4ZN10_LEPMJ|nr:predicted protein [Plenodomus lingam JN3]CBX92613.1 predicted protein [Plenodomus lingam JN3]